MRPVVEAQRAAPWRGCGVWCGLLGVWGSALALAAGCVPAVAHGPRVDPGFSGGLSASLTAGPQYENGNDGTARFLYGPVGVNAGYGWAAARSSRPAVRVGVHVPVPVVALVQPDLYVQAPRRWVGGVDAGVGISLWAPELGRVAMPYVQVGRIADGGSGWYTTQGYFRNDRNTTQRARPVLRTEGWVPTVAYQWGDRRTTTHAFVTGVLGRHLRRCNVESDAVCRRERRWSVMTGVTVEHHRRRRGPSP